MNVPRVLEGLRSVVTNDGAAVLDISKGHLHQLNSTGGLVWKGIQVGKSVAIIIDEIAEETGADREIVSLDVKAFVSELFSKRLLQIGATQEVKDDRSLPE